LTPREELRGGKREHDDSKRITPKRREDVDESKSSRRDVAEDAAEVCAGRGKEG